MANGTPELLIFDSPKTCWNADGTGKSTWYKKVADGLEVPPVLIGKRRKAVPRHERELVARARIRGDSEEQIRDLVRRIVASRKAAQ